MKKVKSVTYKTAVDEPPLIQEPSTRSGKVVVGQTEVLQWPDDGVKLEMTGGVASATNNNNHLLYMNQDSQTEKPKKVVVSSSAIRIGDKIIHLPSKPEDPRVARRSRKLPTSRTMLPASPLTASPSLWDRCSKGRGFEYNGEPSLSVLSYQVLSQEASTGFNHIREKILNGKLRRGRLAEEILFYSADIICLQDVDHYVDFWKDQLTNSGYDVVFHPRTSKVKPRSKTAEGVLIAWSRDLFTLFRSETIDLNDQFEELKQIDGPLAFEAMNDDVGIMVQLQPWQDSHAPSAITVCSAMLMQGPKEKVRTAQAQYLLKRLETFNSDLGLPVILCGGFECVPLSTTYEVLAKGSMPHDPGPPKKISKPPIAQMLSSTSVKLKWQAPEIEVGSLEPSVEGYWLSWRPGGNLNLGFKNGCYVDESTAIVYEVVPTEGGARTEKAEYMQFVITELPSSIPHEFRVAAVNELGIGPWSDSCAAVVGTQLGDNVPEHSALLSMNQWLLRESQGGYSLQEVLTVAKSYKLVSPEDITKMRHSIRDGEHSEFYYVQEVLKLLKRYRVNMPKRSNGKESPPSNMTSKKAQLANMHKFQGETNLSPRFVDGGKHETMTPIRTISTALPLFNSFEQGRDNPSPSPSYSTAALSEENGEEVVVSAASDGGEGGLDLAALEREMRMEQQAAFKRLGGNHSSVGSHDKKESSSVEMISGATDIRQSHRLMLRSAYDNYAWDGEPPFTTSTLEHAACVDYVLYSAEKLEACTVLSLPELHDLTNDDTRDLEMCRDDSAAMMPPAGWNASFNANEAEDNPLAYSGTWVGAIKQNENKTHRYLPNIDYPSSHLALFVEFKYRKQGLEADWSEPKSDLLSKDIHSEQNQ